MEKLYIYVLKCPEGNIRYVGKTNNLKKRLSSHINEAKRGKGRRYVLNWIKSLIILNLKPSIEIIEECNLENWQEREKYWINYYRKLIPNLCNNADGGLGGTGTKNFSKEELQRKKEIMSKTFSKYSIKEKTNIWDMIQLGKTIKEISTIYPNYNRNTHFGITHGRYWSDITNLTPIYGTFKRIGYTCRNGLYMIRKKIDGTVRVIFSSRKEEDVLQWLKNNNDIPLEFGQVIF